MKNCVECEKEFDPRAHNQKYCSSDCCRKATNKKIMANYYANKKRRAGEVRHCAECGNKLSRYNDDTVCETCSKIDADDEVSKVIGGIILNASRGRKRKRA